MLFETLVESLIAHIRERVRSGELSERGIAKDIGISQPHIHNILKGVRSLSLEYADRLLTHLGLSISDLSGEAQPPLSRSASQAPTMEIPIFRGHVGPGFFLEDRPLPGDSYPVAKLLTESLFNPVLVTLAHDPLLFPFLQKGDIALITREFVSLGTLDPLALYLVTTRDGTLVRSLRTGGKRLYLITPATRNEPRNWTELPLLGRKVEEIIPGKLVGLGRLLQGDPFSTSV